MTKSKKLYFCKTCNVWRGGNTKCPECKKKTIPVEAPLKRGSYYYIPGIPKPLPAVTSIINDVYAKNALVYWAAKTAAKAALENPWLSIKEAAGVIYKTKEEAGVRGKDVHRLINDFLQGKKVKAGQKIANYIKAYNKFKKDVPHKVITSEKIVYSKKYGYAGTLDHIIKLRSGELVLIDVKTGKYVYDEAGIQLAAYEQALAEMYPSKRKPGRKMVVHLRPDGTYSFVERNVPFQIFLALKQVWLWQQTLENNNGK